jgi:hypothetical protein
MHNERILVPLLVALIAWGGMFLAPKDCMSQPASYEIISRGSTFQSIQSVDSLPLKEGVFFGLRLPRSWSDRPEIDPITHRHLLDLVPAQGFPADSQDFYLYFINPTSQELRGPFMIGRDLHGGKTLADDFAGFSVVLPPGSRLQLRLNANDGHEPYNMTADYTAFWRVFDVGDLIGQGVIVCRSDTRSRTLRGDLWKQQYRQFASAPQGYEHVACWPPNLDRDPGLFAMQSGVGIPRSLPPRANPVQNNPQGIVVDCLCKRGALYNAYWFSQHLGGAPRTDSVVVLSAPRVCQYGCNDGTSIVGDLKVRIKTTEVNDYMIYKVLMIAEPVP